MNMFEAGLLAFSLSLDCFAISISQGIKVTNKRTILLLALLFGLFQAGMFVGGFFTGSFVLSFIDKFTKWVSFALLLFIGIKMIKEGMEEEHEAANIANFKEYILLSLATSIDAFAAGISFISVKTNFAFISINIGIISFVMALIGGFAGKQIGNKFGKKSEIFGGLVLICLAIKSLL